jgi:hypothetical protein
MNDNNNQNPEAPQTPPGPIVLGEVDAQELQQLIRLKQEADGVVSQLGISRVREYRLLRQLDQFEAATNQATSAIGQRLGIPQGTAWSITTDGKAILVGNPQPQAAQRPNLQPVSDPVESEGDVPTPAEDEAALINQPEE